MTAKHAEQVLSSAFSKILSQYGPPVAVGATRFCKHILRASEYFGYLL